MPHHDFDLSPWKDSSIGKKLYEIRAIYEEIDALTDSFARESGLSCPPECGECCKNFMPDVVSVEINYIAALVTMTNETIAHDIVSNGISPVMGIKKAGASSSADNGTCPFFRTDNPEHCGIYAARPLICRCFGFSAARRKSGEASFALCRYIPHADKRAWAGNEIVAEFGALPPVMADIATKLIAIDPHDAGNRDLLTDALPGALAKVLQIRHLAMSN
jgi:uncharacterized protein